MRTWQDVGINIEGKAPNGNGEVRIPCPKCSPFRKKSKVPCLSVNIEKRVWVCFHCGWAGSLKDGEYSSPQRVKRYLKPTVSLNGKLSEKVLTYFQERGISQLTLEKMKITSGKNYMPTVEKFVETIMFPYFEGGELVNVKYRDARKNFRQIGGAKETFYNIDSVNGYEDIVITEGEMDVLSLVEVGIKNAVSVPNGAPPANAKNIALDFLDYYKELFDKLSMVILAGDNDEPGRLLMAELARRIGKEKCYLAEWPPDCKDANEVLVKHGKEILQGCIFNAKPYPVEGIIEPLTIEKQLRELYEFGYKKTYSTGWKNLDDFYTVRPGEFTLITGVPSHGKSSFLDCLAVNMAELHGWTFAIFSPENLPTERHLSFLIEKHLRKPFRKGFHDRITESELEIGLEWAQSHFYFIVPPEDRIDLDNILSLARVLIFRKGVKGIIIDPWNELEHRWSLRDNETRYISESLSKIRRFARLNDVHIWIVVHPTKLQKKIDGSYPVPTPYDMSGSSHWRNKADNCLTIWRDLEKDSPIVQVHIQKIRFKDVGKIGLTELKYDKVVGYYSS